MKEEEIQKILKNVPGAKRAANGVIVDIGEGNIIHFNNVLKKDDDFINGEHFFRAFCSKNEILRLRDLKNSYDYLLRIRAYAIVDAPRLVRVMLSNKEKYESENRSWSLTEYYNSKNIYVKSYISRLSRKNQKKIKSIPYGFVSIKEANALCIKSILGEVVVASESLRHFYYFMNIALFGNNLGVSYVDQADAAIIAIRIMNGSESLDFDLDPRCKLPQSIEVTIKNLVKYQIEFTFGHEFAHFLFDHLNTENKIVEITNSKDVKVFSHDLEYEADYQSINLIEGDIKSKQLVAFGAFHVFMFLKFLEIMADGSALQKFSVSSTHPDPFDRLKKIITNFGGLKLLQEVDVQQQETALINLKEMVQQRLSVFNRSDALTFYGSVYLPSFIGKMKRDRFDF